MTRYPCEDFNSLKKATNAIAEARLPLQSIQWNCQGRVSKTLIDSYVIVTITFLSSFLLLCATSKFIYCSTYMYLLYLYSDLYEWVVCFVMLSRWIPLPKSFSGFKANRGARGLNDFAEVSQCWRCPWHDFCGHTVGFTQ